MLHANYCKLIDLIDAQEITRVARLLFLSELRTPQGSQSRPFKGMQHAALATVPSNISNRKEPCKELESSVLTAVQLLSKTQHTWNACC